MGKHPETNDFEKKHSVRERQWQTLNVKAEEFYLKLLSWGRGKSHFTVLHSGDFSKYTYPDDPSFQWMIASDALEIFEWNEESSLEAFQTFIDQSNDWIFGGLGYDLKNEMEDLSSHLPDEIEFPKAVFFVPKFIARAHVSGTVEVAFALSLSETQKQLYLKEVEELPLFKKEAIQGIHLAPRMHKSEYLEAISALKTHLKRGDIYEINYCQELFAQHVKVDPLQLWLRLSETASAPFGAFLKWNEKSLVCGSPERYIKKSGNRLISQPIKGTAKRGEHATQDTQIKTSLQADPKERGENVMIVDLVRNDFSRIAAKNSVEVDELFGVYSFPTVHQLISTVSCEVKEEVSFVEVLKASFPMGSMTGAPKVSAMQLAERYERSKRGLYSGSVGYIQPNGNFDFNVVIRALQYNAKSKVVSAIFGGAITDLSNPEKEYEESLLKAEAIQKSLKL